MIFARRKADVTDWTLKEVSACGSLHFECTRCRKISQAEPAPLDIDEDVISKKGYIKFVIVC